MQIFIKYNVYPNISTPAIYWCLGNLKENSAEKILQNYLTGKSVAQIVRQEIPLCEIVKQCGNPSSLRLFGEQDYIDYLVNQYCERKISGTFVALKSLTTPILNR